MSEHVKKFIDDLSNGKNADAGEAFKDALRAKVADGLDKQRVDIASRIFNDKSTEAQDFSDPKPAVTDPSPETETIIDTKGNEVAFETNGSGINNKAKFAGSDIAEIPNEPIPLAF